MMTLILIQIEVNINGRLNAGSHRVFFFNEQVTLYAYCNKVGLDKGTRLEWAERELNPACKWVQQIPF